MVVGEDKITSLPEEILIHILSFMPRTVDAFGTRVLSKRWRHLWTFVPWIIINDLHFSQRFRDVYDLSDTTQRQSMDFIAMIFRLNEVHCLKRLHVLCLHKYPSMGDVINTALSLRHIEDLDLCFEHEIMFPPSVFTSKSLVKLKLHGVVSFNLRDLNLPSLKFMSLLCLSFAQDDCLIQLFNGCPVLEEFILDHYGPRNGLKSGVCIKSSSLKRLDLSIRFETSFKLTVDAVKLERLRITDDSRYEAVVQYDMRNLISLSQVELNLGKFIRHRSREPNHFSQTRLLHPLLMLTNAKYLTLSCTVCVKSPKECKNKFHNLTHLELKDYYRPSCGNLCSETDCLQVLPYLLERSPNLVKFTWEKEKRPHRRSAAPFKTPLECLMLRLEEIELTGLGGTKDEIQMISYILYNAPVLKKIRILNKQEEDEEEQNTTSMFFDQILTCPRSSLQCQIMLC